MTFLMLGIPVPVLEQMFGSLDTAPPHNAHDDLQKMSEESYSLNMTSH